jgi:hypothetical protein
MGTDWTGLLADPDLARNLGKLLQTYRDAAPDRRDQALLAAMREIKQASSGPATSMKVAPEHQPQPVPGQPYLRLNRTFSARTGHKIAGVIPELSVSSPSNCG